MNNISNITVISPHQDDAALSLGCTLSYWCSLELSLRIRIVNCYTHTNYAPFTKLKKISEIKKLRKQEDKTFYDKIGNNNVTLVNLNEEDSLIRLRENSLDKILKDRDLTPMDILHLAKLYKKLVPHLKGIVFVPLGIENHIDHRLVCLVALFSNIKQENIFFYFDVPYWLRVPIKTIKEKVEYIKAITQTNFGIFSVHKQKLTFKKTLLGNIYSSQITPQEATIISKAPFRGEILLAPLKAVSFLNKLQLQRLGWTDLNH